LAFDAPAAHAHKKNKEQGTCVLSSPITIDVRSNAASCTLAFEKRRDFDRATFAIKMTIKVTAAESAY
jgi:hypothetical protein